MILTYTLLHCTQCNTTHEILTGPGSPTPVGICNGPNGRKHLKPVLLENHGTKRVTVREKRPTKAVTPPIRKGTIKRRQPPTPEPRKGVIKRRKAS